MAAVSVNLDVRDVVAALHALHDATPLVHALVGPGVAPVAASALAAVGAVSSSAGDGRAAPAPAVPAGRAGSVLVGLGGLDEEGTRAAHRLATTASEQGTAWVLDPGTAGGPAWLARKALHLLTCRPTVVRGTAAEVLSLAGAGDRVADAVSIEQAFQRVGELARRTGAVVAVSGEVDLVTDGERAVRLEGGDPRLAVVPGVGTALAALVAAYAAVVDDAVLAAVAAHTHVAAAAAAAARSGATDFAAAWAGALATVDAAALTEGVHLV